MILNNKLDYIINSKEISSLNFPNFILGLAAKSFFFGVFGVVFPSADRYRGAP
jgi:ABC-type dipeptide/oligopeptide/nickel transport system permease component